MQKPNLFFKAWVLAGAMVYSWPVTAIAQGDSVTLGRVVAQRHCSTCHAVAAGDSPLPDAPPFTSMQARYGAGGLAELLEKGMIKDWPRPLEEGTRLLHPRMPAFQLSESEVIALADYLRTFETTNSQQRPKGK